MTETLIAMLAFTMNPDTWAGLIPAIGNLLALGLVGFGTVIASNVKQGDTFYTCDLIATATTGDSLAIPHNLGSIPLNAGSAFAGLGPQDFQVVPLNALGRASGWVVTVNTTNATVTKASIAASASSVVQAKLMVKLPHSLVR